PVTVKRPDQIGGEDEAALEHGDHHQVVEPPCSNVPGKLIDAGGDGFGAVERPDRPVRKRFRGRHFGLAKPTLRLLTVSGAPGICSVNAVLAPAASESTLAVACISSLPVLSCKDTTTVGTLTSLAVGLTMSPSTCSTRWSPASFHAERTFWIL